MSIKKGYLFYSLLFIIIGFCTLNFNYVEGDDAQTILYHVFGRDASFQPPYSPYHSMFDKVLSLVASQSEVQLRIIGYLLSFGSGALVLFLLANITDSYFEKQKQNLAWFILALPFLIPEILFSGLIINPTNISFALVLLSHWFLVKYVNTMSRASLIWSIVLFGFGASFRWSMGFYIFVLYGHYMFLNASSIKSLITIERFKKSVLIFPFYVISVILWIQVSGYSLYDIFEVYINGSKYIENKETSILSIVAMAIPFITPGVGLLFLIGTIYCIKEKKIFPLALLVFSILPYFTMGIIPMYKYMITVVPPLLLILAYGFLSIKKKSFKYILAVAIILPWFIGIQIKSNSAWGPGFEVRSTTNDELDESNFNPDRSTSFKNFNIVFGSGMAMPTSEGPRPLYGFGQVFLSDWYSFVKSNNTQRESSVNYAIENNCNILQDVNHSLISSKLSEFGYVPENEFNALGKFGKHRNFNANGKQLSVNVFKDKKELFNNELMNSFLMDSKNNKVVIYVTYTNIMTKLQAKYKDQFQQRGPFWGVLTLK